MEEEHRYHSIFWPVLLIGVGLLWLARDMNMVAIPPINLNMLFNLWPLLLVMGGLHLLIGNRMHWLRALLDIFSVVLVFGLVLAGPQMGYGKDPTIKINAISEDINGASSAVLDLTVSDQLLTLNPMNPGDERLLTGQLKDFKPTSVEIEGEGERFITINGEPFNFTLWMGMPPAETAHWDLNFNPEIPFEMIFSLDSGIAEINLETATLKSLKIEGGSGALQLHLPEPVDDYILELDGGSGLMDIYLPPGAAAHLELLDKGSGKLIRPENFMTMKMQHSQLGEWQTPNFREGEPHILIQIINMSSGDIVFH